ncbi:metallothionein-like protein 4A [Benincasa hispida]|uniref:metallothionein-like protein 4A n=1 Tax=Benincasa hispida TaxID=102211 RepID=UPI001900EADD|nr:metallothionein-like protein 4A [Benincasa hispida]
MAESGGGGGVRTCNQSCGCAVPCPGGNACRCATATAPAPAGGEMAHRRCPCGEHCGCNPVSYTHLDVYKRQALGCVVKCGYVSQIQ